MKSETEFIVVGTNSSSASVSWELRCPAKPHSMLSMFSSSTSSRRRNSEKISSSSVCDKFDPSRKLRMMKSTEKSRPGHTGEDMSTSPNRTMHDVIFSFDYFLINDIILFSKCLTICQVYFFYIIVYITCVICIGTYICICHFLETVCKLNMLDLLNLLKYQELVLLFPHRVCNDIYLFF